MTCTVRQMTIRSRVDDIAETLFQLLVAGEVECMGGPCPHRCDIQASDRPPDALGPHDAPQSVHYVAVAGGWIGLQALHAGLKENRENSKTENDKNSL